MNEEKRIIENEKMKEVDGLYLDVYALFCKLTRYKDKLTEQTFRYMADRLYWLTREEFERIFAQYAIEREQEKYKHKKKRTLFVPRESWFFHRKNLAAKFFFDGINTEADGFFGEFKKKLKEKKHRRRGKHGKRCQTMLPPTGGKDRGEQAAPPLIPECVQQLEQPPLLIDKQKLKKSLESRTGKRQQRHK